MKNSQLIITLRALSRPDMKAALQWLNGVTPAPRPKVRELFGYLFQQWPFEKGEKVSKNAIWSAIYPDIPFDDKQLRYVASFCHKEIKKWLAFQALQEDAALEALLRGRSYSRLGLSDLLEAEIEQTQKMLEKQPQQNSRLLLHALECWQLKYEAQQSQRRSDIGGLTEMADSLTAWFVAERLRQACAVQLHQQIHNASISQSLLEECLVLAGEAPFSGLPAVAIYYHSFLALRDSDAAHFRTLCDWLPKVSAVLGATEGRDVFLIAINFCIRQINRGERQWLNEVLGLYQSGLEQEVFMENGRLSRFTFNNIVLAALGLQNYPWARQFIESYQHYIDPDFREGAVHYNLAMVAYRQQDYPEAMRLLQLISRDDTLQQLDARRMLLRIYFDLREFDALESLLDSFKLYIYRQQELGYHRELYLNLIRFVKALIQLPPGDRAARLRLREQIESNPSIAERAWLLQQLP